MAKLYYEKDADLGPLKGKTVAVVGYGIQGRAQALNLHDSGIEVVVAARRNGESWAAAKKDGLDVETIPEAVASAGGVVMLVPDEVQAEGDAKGGGRGRRGDLRPRLGSPRAPRGPPRRDGEREADRPRDREGSWLDEGRRHRDDVHGGVRDGPIRRAGGPVRRRVRAHQDVLRGPREGGLPAGARVLRGPPRAQDDRRPDPGGRDREHVGERLEHRGVRGPYARPEGDRRPRAEEHGGAAQGHQERRLREGLGRGVPARDADPGEGTEGSAGLDAGEGRSRRAQDVLVNPGGAMQAARLECVQCGATYGGQEDRLSCDECGDGIRVVVDMQTLSYDNLRARWRERPFRLWRYRELLPVTGEEVALDEGGTGLRAAN